MRRIVPTRAARRHVRAATRQRRSTQWVARCLAGYPPHSRSLRPVRVDAVGECDGVAARGRGVAREHVADLVEYRGLLVGWQHRDVAHAPHPVDGVVAREDLLVMEGPLGERCEPRLIDEGGLAPLVVIAPRRAL